MNKKQLLHKMFRIKAKADRLQLRNAHDDVLDALNAQYLETIHDFAELIGCPENEEDRNGLSVLEWVEQRYDLETETILMNA